MHKIFSQTLSIEIAKWHIDCLNNLAVELLYTVTQQVMQRGILGIFIHFLSFLCVFRWMTSYRR